MTATLPHVRSHSPTEPPHPFHTIYVDHKTMPRSLDTEFHYSLVECGMRVDTLHYCNSCTRHLCGHDAASARGK
eukprot:1420829-Pleurochrysis_carterae.AAC.1